MGSTGVGYAFTDHFKLNFDVTDFEGKFRYTTIKDSFWTFMVAPEYVSSFSANNQFCALLGAGMASMGSKSGMGYYISGQSRFAAELGLGYRHFFGSVKILSHFL